MNSTILPRHLQKLTDHIFLQVQGLQVIRDIQFFANLPNICFDIED